MKWKIIADSGCDYRSLDNLAPDTEFVSVPLTIQVSETIYRDDAQLNIDQMMEKMYATTTASKSACPSPDDYMKSFEGTDNIVVVTITGTLSGSYNSAEIAKKIYLEEHPDTKIHVIDSLSAGGEVDLIVRKLNHLVAEGLDFDQVVDGITAYQAKTKLLFVLAKVDNLVKNGRLSKLVGTVVGLLNIRMVGEASKTSKLPLMNSSRLVMLEATLRLPTATMKNLSSNSLNWFVKNLPKQASKSFLLLDSVAFMLKKADSLWGMKFKTTLKRGWTTCSVF